MALPNRLLIDSQSAVESTYQTTAPVLAIQQHTQRMADERLDIVIFGATGCVAKYAVKEAERLAKEENFTWGVADRCEEELKSVLKEFAPLSENIRIIIADIKDEASLKKMTKQARVLVNCYGPHRFYGEAVIKACIATRTHHVDASWETHYMERMELVYNKAAKESGIYIVSACGIESIPSDLGIIYTQNQFDGEINSIETYLNFWMSPSVNKVSLHYEKWLSGVYELSHQNDLCAIRAELYSEKLPELEPKVKFKGIVHRRSVSKGWSRILRICSLFVGQRTQRFLYERYKQRPIQLQTYLTYKSWWHVVKATMVGTTAFLFTRYLYGRSLLLKYPKFFSGGVASHEGPTQESMENSHYSITFLAKGWPEKMDHHRDPPTKEMVTRVSGINPEYGITNTALLISALVILKDSDRMPDEGGVFTPGAAFGKTSMIEELIKHGLKFEVVSNVEK